jgi:hypothetical protein
LATGLDSQDAKAILDVLIRDALDKPGEHLAIGCGMFSIDSVQSLSRIRGVGSKRYFEEDY